ncbi:MAG TPA: HIT family protein [Anaerolineaceae bacterium]|jgi:histidine triad (HIT) family protein|nr:HIT family protein [Anaerolineaceae bacterium]
MDDCIFCKIIKGDIPSYKVYEDEYCFAFLDVQPISRYHTLVVPKKHYENLYDIPEDVYKQVMKATKKVVDMYRDKLGIVNTQLFNNSGPLTLQTVFHFHMHIVPRTEEDKHQFKLDVRSELVSEFPEMIKKLG